jgi:hypothetical protein
MALVLDGSLGVTFPVTAGSASAVQASSGRVLQVVNATYSTEASTTGGTYIDTGLTATITPSSASNKILVIVDQVGLAKAAGNGGVFVQVLRGSTSLLVMAQNDAYTGGSVVNRIGGVGANYLDSPATTSATTYKTQYYAFNSVTAYVQQGNSTSTITLMEIAA